MISKVVIRNWQSLREVDLPLGRFTVITGASSSGKTAFMRALRALVSNMRGTTAITRGASFCTIAAHAGTRSVTLERSQHGGQYRLTDLGGERVYTKLAGGVPEAVTNTLRLDPELSFAGQFDRPYLLGESGATVARILGELTNVSTIFAAVREANRRRAATAATLKTREADLAELVEAARTYAGLPAQLAACQIAEERAESAACLSDRVHRLKAALDALTVAEGVLARTAVPQVPDDTAVQHAAARLARLRTLMHTTAQGANQAQRATGAIAHAAGQEKELETELHATLAAAGTCPTCGQRVT